ncbi:MAG TPA: cobalt-precorrin-5B (C(1))-methyltransferase [Acidimicrobiales bacterium]
MRRAWCPPPAGHHGDDGVDTTMGAQREGEAGDTGTAGRPLRRGWTTGACATAATRAAIEALLGGTFPDPVRIRLPRGQEPAFALALSDRDPAGRWARAGVVKDAGDDPDVTHGALVVATVRPGPPGSGVVFRAGEGVGTVTLPGLPLAVGEPAINPVPRRMMAEVVAGAAARHGVPADVEVEVAVPGGEEIARHTWNGRLGIVGGLSILGTTGVVVPYSCSAWIHSIHRGVDIARATGHRHVAGCTGSTSERAVQERLGLPDVAMLDMGDFAGGLLRYLRRRPVPRLTIGGGFAKLSKLAVGHLDLHSARSQVDRAWLAGLVGRLGAPSDVVEACRSANTALEVLDRAAAVGVPVADAVADAAAAVARDVLDRAPVAVDVLVVDRAGAVVGAGGEVAAT